MRYSLSSLEKDKKIKLITSVKEDPTLVLLSSETGVFV